LLESEPRSLPRWRPGEAAAFGRHVPSCANPLLLSRRSGEGSRADGAEYLNHAEAQDVWAGRSGPIIVKYDIQNDAEGDKDGAAFVLQGSPEGAGGDGLTVWAPGGASQKEEQLLILQ
ncbi:unnamed protein product, partial [Prorocentrum cordatum]